MHKNLIAETQRKNIYSGQQMGKFLFCRVIIQVRGSTLKEDIPQLRYLLTYNSEHCNKTQLVLAEAIKQK